MKVIFAYFNIDKGTTSCKKHDWYHPGSSSKRMHMRRMTEKNREGNEYLQHLDLEHEPFKWGQIPPVAELLLPTMLNSLIPFTFLSSNPVLFFTQHILLLHTFYLSNQFKASFQAHICYQWMWILVFFSKILNLYLIASWYHSITFYLLL